nr:LOW QUALITY PROTEIN: thioredoxin-dependent peroxide reductase, mitochondrial-like [Oryctolagus cuniculus]
MESVNPRTGILSDEGQRRALDNQQPFPPESHLQLLAVATNGQTEQLTGSAGVRPLTFNVGALKLAAAVARLLWALLARNVGFIPRGRLASAAPRPAASGTLCLTHILQSGAKLAFSTSPSHCAPTVTQPTPYFKGTAVANGEFKDLSLNDFKGKYLVLLFYPLDFTFVRPTEIVAFSDKANEFHNVLNCEVVAVSVDSHFSHLAWINTPLKNGGLGHMNILSDLTKQIAWDYGVLLEGPGLALRGLFIIDPNGIIKHLSVNDLPVGRSVEETLHLVKAFQYVKTHREVCPANWTPESPTIKPHPTTSKEYFEKVNQ